MASTNILSEQAEASVRCSPQLGDRPSPRPRVLVADDDRGIRESLGKLLRGCGYHVTLAANGGQVLEQALNEDLNLILLDLNMPEMDGWDALDHLVRLKPALPIIIITAQPNQLEWVMTAGAHALMEKPLDLSRLLQTAEDFVRKPPGPQDASSARHREQFRFGWPRRNCDSGPQPFRNGGLNE